MLGCGMPRRGGNSTVQKTVCGSPPATTAIQLCQTSLIMRALLSTFHDGVRPPSRTLCGGRGRVKFPLRRLVRESRDQEFLNEGIREEPLLLLRRWSQNETCIALK